MSKTISYSGSASSHPVSYDSGYSAYSVSGLNQGNTDSTSTNYATINFTRGNAAETIIFYNFDLDIPSAATITSVTCKAKCYISTTNSSRIATRLIRLYSGSTAMGSAHTVSNSTSEFTMTPGTWTAAQLNNAKVRLYAKRGSSNTTTNYYYRFYGATLSVEYTVNGTAYEITTSSNVDGVTIQPATQDVIEGESGSVVVSSITDVIITDNGTDVTSLLVQKLWTNPSYTVDSVSGALYGFTLTSGWYLSQNAGVSNSAALCRVNFDLSVPCNITFTYINYAEATYDFGVFSKLDTALSTTAWTSSSNSGDTTTDAGLEERRLNTSAYNTSSLQTLTYSNVSAGTHFIDVKFGKDQSTNSNNDNLKFLVSITPLETVPTGYYYEYTISNIAADHAVVVSTAAPVSVTGVTLNTHSQTIEEEETYLLTATVAPSNASNKTVTWGSSNTSIATVSSTGLVTGVSAGSATITVTTQDGSYTDTCTIIVTAIVYSEYVLTDTLTPGNSYIIANGNTGLVYVLSGDSGGSRQLVAVSATVIGSTLRIRTSNVAKCLFPCVEYTSGNDITTTLTYDNKYLYCNNSSGLRFQTSSSLDRFWHYNSTKFWQFKSATADGYDDTSSEYKYYLTYSNGNFTDNHVSTTSVESSTNIPAMYLYTIAPSDKLYIKLSGSWVQVNKIYKKISGSWQEVSVDSLTDPAIYYYVGS